MWVDTICCPQTPLGVVPSDGPRSDALKVPANVFFFYLQIFQFTTIDLSHFHVI